MSDRVMMADKVVGGIAGRYVSSGVNGTFGLVRLMSARVKNVLSMSATECSAGCSPLF